MCPTCQALLRVARQEHSDFISYNTIRTKVGVSKGQLLYHMHILRKKRLVSRKFGRLRSQKAEQAYRIYFKKRLPILTIGRHVGLTNFSGTIAYQKILGWDVPDSLFKYDGKERRKALLKRSKRKSIAFKEA